MNTSAKSFGKEEERSTMTMQCFCKIFLVKKSCIFIICAFLLFVTEVEKEGEEEICEEENEKGGEEQIFVKRK